MYVNLDELHKIVNEMTRKELIENIDSILLLFQKQVQGLDNTEIYYDQYLYEAIKFSEKITYRADVKYSFVFYRTICENSKSFDSVRDLMAESLLKHSILIDKDNVGFFEETNNKLNLVLDIFSLVKVYKDEEKFKLLLSIIPAFKTNGYISDTRYRDHKMEEKIIYLFRTLDIRKKVLLLESGKYDSIIPAVVFRTDFLWPSLFGKFYFKENNNSYKDHIIRYQKILVNYLEEEHLLRKHGDIINQNSCINSLLRLFKLLAISYVEDYEKYKQLLIETHKLLKEGWVGEYLRRFLFDEVQLRFVYELLDKEVIYISKEDLIYLLSETEALSLDYDICRKIVKKYFNDRMVKEAYIMSSKIRDIPFWLEMGAKIDQRIKGKSVFETKNRLKFFYILDNYKNLNFSSNGKSSSVDIAILKKAITFSLSDLNTKYIERLINFGYSKSNTRFSLSYTFVPKERLICLDYNSTFHHGDYYNTARYRDESYDEYIEALASYGIEVLSHSVSSRNVSKEKYKKGHTVYYREITVKL